MIGTGSPRIGFTGRDPLLGEVFGGKLPPEPERLTETVVDVWLGARN